MICFRNNKINESELYFALILAPDEMPVKNRKAGSYTSLERFDGRRIFKRTNAKSYGYDSGARFVTPYKRNDYAAVKHMNRKKVGNDII